MARYIAAFFCVVAMGLVVSGIGQLGNEFTYTTIKLDDMTQGIADMRKGRDHLPLSESEILARCINKDMAGIARIGAGVVMAIIALGALLTFLMRPAAKPPFQSVSRSRISESDPTPSEGTIPGQRQGEDAAAWAKRVEAEEIAAFKARSKK
jgi:hypothetical protein